MKIKGRPTDFRVQELLAEGVLRESGEHRIYLVTKRKLTSLEAARVLADLVGVGAGEVSMAGLKDRQGVTRQYMSVLGGRSVNLRRPELTIEDAGFAERALTSTDSRGNAFRVVVRDLGDLELERMRRGLAAVRAHGLPNYFAEQRFGNLRHGQGWIARDLMLGREEEALKRLLCRVSQHDDDRARRFKSALFRHWGQWPACREIAGRFGAHHSLFDHLVDTPGDFAGAFRYVAVRTRLIHLYAYQSHVWNRVVTAALERTLPPHRRFTMRGIEGPLVFPKGPFPPEIGTSVPLAGAGLEGVDGPRLRSLYASVLEEEGLDPRAFRIDGVPGFALKAEERELAVRPRALRVRPADADPERPGRRRAILEFELPRGAYATLVVRRLVGPSPSGGPRRQPPGRARSAGGRPSARRRRPLP